MTIMYHLLKSLSSPPVCANCFDSAVSCLLLKSVVQRWLTVMVNESDAETTAVKK